MKLSKETYQKLLNNSINTKTSKYHNKKCIYDGIKFDSKKEMYRWIYLKQLEDYKKINNLQRQVKYELQPSYIINNKKIRAITYIADFVYEENNKIIVEDTKGMRTDVYKLKKKLFEYKYNIEIKEV